MTVRVVVLCALVALIASASACSQESAADSGPAGKVIELTGTATATRAGVDRPLSVGSEVFADDEVATAEGAEIAIAIAHNGARWVLGGGQKRKLIESAAWRAEKGSEAAAALDGDDQARTAAAGRHSEREAAETAASATEDNKQAEAAPAAAEAAPAAAEAAASPPPGQAPVPPPQATPAPAPAELPRKQARVSAARTRNDEAPRENAETPRANSSGGDAKVEAAPPPPPPLADAEAAPIAPPDPVDPATTRRQTRGAGTAETGAAAAAPQPRTFSVAVGSIEATGALTTAQARAQAGKLRGRIGLCAKLTVIGKMTVVLSVSAQGKVTAVKIESIEAALGDQFEQCVLTRIRGAKFPAASGATKVKLTITAKGE